MANSGRAARRNRARSQTVTGTAAGLAYDRCGSGRPLLLIHPIGAERGFWYGVVDRLARGREVILADLPGFGESPPLPADRPPTPRALARGVADMLDELGVTRADVAGSSLGAWVALELAVLGRALTVTAICPSGVGPSQSHGRPPRFAVPLMPLLLRSTRFRRRAMGYVMAHPERAPRDALVRFCRAMATAPGFDATYRELHSARFSAWDAVRVPTTLAWAELDTQVTPIPPPRPDIRSVTLADCGHVAIFDNPDEVVRVLLASIGRGA